MGQKITIVFDTDKSGEGNFFQIDNGIKAAKAIQAFEYLINMIKQKAEEKARKAGLDDNTPIDEARAFFENQLLEELF